MPPNPRLAFGFLPDRLNLGRRLVSKPFARRFRIASLKLPELYERVYESVPLAASLLVPSFDTQGFPGDLRQSVFVLAPVTPVIVGVNLAHPARHQRFAVPPFFRRIGSAD